MQRLCALPFSGQIPVFGYYADSADPVQSQQNVASDQGLHCLLTGISMLNTVKLKAST